jgi:TonB-dependent SusC/RagA subfamily outer membrane receptor
MKNKFRLLIAFITLAIINLQVNAQNNRYAYAKEKIYVQTDHVFYNPGDVMYFKLYLVKGTDQTVSAQSNTAFTEIISPAGTVVKKLILKVNDGYAEGAFDFTTDAAGGIYKIKAYTSWMQNETDSTFFSKEITLQQYIAPRILMKLDFPAKGYGAGDEVKADFCVRSLSDEALKFYQGDFTISIDGSIKEKGKFTTDNSGKYQLQFRLPKDITTTDGLLNISMQQDGFTESISRNIPIVLNKIDVQYMPEGGTLVNGLANFIAFKAVNEFGKPVDIAGFITDKGGNTIATYESTKFGMGKFLITPAANQEYTVHITTPSNISGTFSLPIADNRGIIMNMLEENNQLLLKLQSNYTVNVKLIAQCKGIDYLVENIQLSGSSKTIHIDKTKFPAGIAQFTLYDETDRPLSERLFFMNSGKLLTLTISPDKQQYQPREKVTLQLLTRDENNQPVPSNLSLSVVDDKLWTMADDKQHHIISWLLLGSELRGKIEEPAFYFKKDDAKAAAAMDLLMLTHGYRYFDFIPYVTNEGKLKYTGDLENIISGNILDVNGLPASSKVYLVNPITGSKALYANTAKDGAFFFSNLDPQINYFLIAQSKKTKQEISINIIQQGLGQNPFKQTVLYKKEIPGKNIPQLIQQAAVKNPNPAPVNKVNLTVALGGKTSQLNEVVVVGYGALRKKDLTSAITIVNAKDINPTVSGVSTALAGKVAGLQVIARVNPGAASSFQLRGFRSITGNNEPLYIINGIPTARIDASFNVNDIENITVLKDAAATAIYGAAAANGVIIIQEKRSPNNGALKFNLSKKNFFASKQIRTGGSLYTVVKRFYAPVYETTATDVRNDFRETIYWNPVVQTDENGKAIVEFYNSDATTTFRTIAEGVGYNGLLGNAEKTYSTKALIAADIKVPPYLTTGDKALLPLTIKNNGLELAQFSIETDAVKGIYFDSFNNQFNLAAGESKQILLPATALAVTKDSLSVWVKTTDSRQLIRVPIAVAQKGFPVVATMSGMSSATHTFSVSQPIPGSLQAELKLYKDVEGQLLDGIESMLREPYGCFEQTSSTTYPNIFILKYLQESGRLNPAIRQKAMGYIERGYKRLIGFETSENGFEWFGHAPAHEALTAYGLLEFTDMQAFVEVDKKMLQRTLDFLLKKRDGNGGFKIASGGYDRFASVPNKIANLYIVYAITQAGAGSRIVPEYEAAVKKALESNDAYQMALMAIAADNMKESQHYEQLMAKLYQQFNENKINAQTSVVNSKDASLRVESRSLFVMAILRSQQPDMAKAAALLSSIMAEKNYYGYGSTQSTVLAYSKLAGKQAAANDIEFTLNNKKITTGNLPIDGVNSFNVQYKSNGNLPYQYEVSYFTYTPPNSNKAALKLQTALSGNVAKTGETVRLNIAVSNKQDNLQPMAIAKIGIPAGLSLQPWQLKQLTEENKVAYYEIFDNYLVLYWMGFASNETKTITLDLKADIPGTYTAKASNAYLYYTPEHKHWNEGLSVEVKGN